MDTSRVHANKGAATDPTPVDGSKHHLISDGHVIRLKAITTTSTT
ncbi:hypothetical protein [Streptacidiphilus sp. EB103A]